MKTKEILSLALIAILFIASAYFSNIYKENLRGMIEGYMYIGALIYVLVLIVSAVIAPINALPLLPVASMMWGPINAAVLSAIGWIIGSILIYWLLQKYGRPLISKFIDLNQFDRYHINIPEENKFWVLIGLRMIVPVDVLSYILGLFVPMSYRLYIMTTIIGVTPPAFALAYAATLSMKYQLFVGVIGVGILLFGILKLKKFYVLTNTQNIDKSD